MRRSTDSLIALQFLAVALPVTLVLLAQLAMDARRAAALEYSRPLRILADEARANYRTFTNGAADAVDTGSLGRQSAEALHTAAALLRELAARGEAAALGATPQQLQQLADAIGNGAQLATLIPLRDAISRGDQQTRAIDADFIRRDQDVVRDAIRSAIVQKRAVTVALFISAAFTVVFVLMTRRRMQQQLAADAAIELRLRDASRQAGMAEVAANVLHNVGNVLNSVNVSASLLADSVRRSRAGGLDRVAALLQEHAGDLGAFVASDPQGRHLPVYLGQLATHLVAEQRTNLGELESLRRNIEHIKEVVAMQQSYAKLAGVTETVDVADLVEQALRLNSDGLEREAVALVREFAAVPPITVDKHRVLQILVNLLRNAKHACQHMGRDARRIVVAIAPHGDGVQISVADNGIGIAPGNLTRIFNHGFTTKAGGHGFGLHSGALAARELGGALRVDSHGAGQGATFTLELPLQPHGPQP